MGRPTIQNTRGKVAGKVKKETNSLLQHGAPAQGKSGTKSQSEEIRQLKEKISELSEKNKLLRRRNQKLLEEKNQIWESFVKMILYLRRMQERMEEWNGQDGKFFGRIVSDLQHFYGCLSVRDMARAEAALKDLKDRVYDNRKILRKKNPFKVEERKDWQLTLEDLNEALQKFEEDMERCGKNVLYQNLLFPLLCILMDADLREPDGAWKEEIDEVLQAEGLQALYYGELPPDDAANRSLFIEINNGIEDPGLFRHKAKGGYELFGNAQGLVRKSSKGDE